MHTFPGLWFPPPQVVSRCCRHLCPLSILTLLYFFHAIVQVHQESQETPLLSLPPPHQSAHPNLLNPPQVLQTQLDTLRQGQEHIGSSCSFANRHCAWARPRRCCWCASTCVERLAALAAQAFPERPHENATAGASPRGRRAAEIGAQSGRLLTTSATAHEDSGHGRGLAPGAGGPARRPPVTTKDKDGRLVAHRQRRAACGDHRPGWHALGCPVVDHKNGTYELVYTARTEGELLLSVLLYGQPVRGSPSVRALCPGDLPPSPDDVKRALSPRRPG